MDRDLLAQVETPEQVSHRFHLLRVVVTLSAIGIITIVIGLAALLDLNNVHPLRYLAGCAFVSIVCGLAVLYLVNEGGETTYSVEAAMLAGLFAAFANTLYGGLLEVDPWWQVCGYVVVLFVAGGVSLRRWSAFALFIVVGLMAWSLAIATADEPTRFLLDSCVLVLLGCTVAAAILWLFRIERKRVTELNKVLHINAMHDPLTGVMNRHGLLTASLKDEISADNAWCAYVDVDYFKSINDLRGHDHGDDVLRAVAHSLTESGGRWIARWGGDEFVVLGIGVPPREETIQQQVISDIRRIEPNGSVTVGLVTGSIRDKKDLSQLLKDADQRMYARRAEARGQQPPAIA